MGAESERGAGFGPMEDGLRQAGDWYRWGPYVSERQWGTVREDYSPDADTLYVLPTAWFRNTWSWEVEEPKPTMSVHQSIPEAFLPQRGLTKYWGYNTIGYFVPHQAYSAAVTLQLIMDSLRYWLTEMHVDGCRFDLAPALARQEGEFEARSAFFDLVSQDPVVSRAKLVAEPWDVGQMDSYDLGRFPLVWREWNGKYRDPMRNFWRSHPVGIGEFASRFCGPSDMYRRARRRPTASVNLITVHDGFTLRDLVSYSDKHNEANGESNRDGTSDNPSWNCGAEGATDDPVVLALLARQSRAMLATLMLSFGIPMLLGGDEMGRTQQGNNNAYCQDNEITWFDWSAQDTALLAFTKQLVALRKAHPVFRRNRFLAGAEASELRWFTPAGTEISGAAWSDLTALAVALYLDGSDDPDRAAHGTRLVDDDFLVLVNACWEPLDFVLPDTRPQGGWQVEIDTYDPGPEIAGDATT